MAPPYLTTREKQIVALIADGASNEDIAHKLLISHSTVKNTIKRLYTKTNIHSRAEIVAWALREGHIQ